MKLIVFTMLIALAVGCESRIDGSSEESFKSSIADMKEGLTEEQQTEFQNALMVVSMKDVNFGAMLAGVQTGDTMVQDARRSLDGKSREEVVQWAEEIRTRRKQEQERAARERLEAEIEEAKREVEELQTRKRDAAAAKESLSKFVVTRAKYSKQKQRFMGPKPIIDLSVRNDTGSAVSRAYFEGTLKSPGREIPWLQDTFNYEISGGLEPGESADWSLAPNMFSEWGTVDPGADAILHVEVLRLDGPGGEALFDASGWDSSAEARLQKLADFLANPTPDSSP